MPVIFDLLGDPVPENWGKRGRPMHTPTDEKRKLIIQLLADDWTFERIAATLGISVPTMKKNYLRELKLRGIAHDRVKATLLSALMAGVESGSIPAVKEYNKITAQQEARRAGKNFTGVESGPRKVKLGKKVMDKMAADTAGEGTGWGNDLLPPGFERAN